MKIPTDPFCPVCREEEEPHITS